MDEFPTWGTHYPQKHNLSLRSKSCHPPCLEVHPSPTPAFKSVTPLQKASNSTEWILEVIAHLEIFKPYSPFYFYWWFSWHPAYLYFQAHLELASQNSPCIFIFASTQNAQYPPSIWCILSFLSWLILSLIHAWFLGHKIHSLLSVHSTVFNFPLLCSFCIKFAYISSRLKSLPFKKMFKFVPLNWHSHFFIALCYFYFQLIFFTPLFVITFSLRIIKELASHIFFLFPVAWRRKVLMRMNVVKTFCDQTELDFASSAT